jgi:hypothetical protein
MTALGPKADGSAIHGVRAARAERLLVRWSEVRNTHDFAIERLHNAVGQRARAETYNPSKCPYMDPSSFAKACRL